MRVDLGRQLTDRKLEELERKIRKEYRIAEKDLRNKLNEYLRAFKVKDAIKRNQMMRGVISPAEYREWRIGQIMVGKRWQAMLDNISDDLANADKIAKSITRGYMPEVYAINMNYATYDIEHKMSIDTSFVLYNRETVEQIIRDEPQLLPMPGMTMQRRIAAGGVVKWRKGQIQSVVLQSIVQGESIPNMATRIARDLCVSDRKAAIRYARTACTGAENAGRDDSFARMVRLGIKVKRQWIAVLDARTRDAHRELDGQIRAVGEPFENSIGKIMRPGDPSADGANLWNCRCGTISVIEGFERDASDMSWRTTYKMGDMTYDEWKKAHGKSQNILMPDMVADLMRARYARDYRR